MPRMTFPALGVGIAMAAAMTLIPALSAAEPREVIGERAAQGIVGVVVQVRSAVLFVKVPGSLQPRTISPNRADRIGLHEAKVGDRLLLWVDEGNVLLDVHREGIPPAGHRIIAGTLHYADAYWSEIKLSTPEGIERFEVDSLMGSKLSVLHTGAALMVELDEDNVAINVYPAR